MTFDDQLEQARKLDSVQARALIRQMLGTPAFAGFLSLLLAHREAAIQAVPRYFSDHAKMAALVGAYDQLDATLDVLRQMTEPDAETDPQASGAA